MTEAKKEKLKETVSNMEKLIKSIKQGLEDNSIDVNSEVYDCLNKAYGGLLFSTQANFNKDGFSFHAGKI